MANSKRPRSNHRRAMRQRVYPIVTPPSRRARDDVIVLAVARTLQAIGRTLQVLAEQLLKIIRPPGK